MLTLYFDNFVNKVLGKEWFSALRILVFWDKIVFMWVFQDYSLQCKALNILIILVIVL